MDYCCAVKGHKWQCYGVTINKVKFIIKEKVIRECVVKHYKSCPKCDTIVEIKEKR